MAPPDAGARDLAALLVELSPQLCDGEFVFCTVPGGVYGDGAELQPVAAFSEDEGLTLVLPAAAARQAGFPCDQPMRLITLGVQSSLQAVGLTAAVAAALAAAGIAANVVAAYHHDHLFVPAVRAGDALAVLRELAG